MFYLQYNNSLLFYVLITFNYAARSSAPNINPSTIPKIFANKHISFRFIIAIGDSINNNNFKLKSLN